MGATINGSGLSSVSVTSGYSDVTGSVNVTSGDVYVSAGYGTISGQISNTGGSMEVSAKTINTSIATTGGSLSAGATRDIAGTISDHGGDINSIAAGGSISATISDTGGNIIPPLYTNGPSISAGEDLSGSITDTGGNILGVNIGRSMTSAGSLVATSGNISSVTVGGNLSGMLEADEGQIDGVTVGFLLGQISAATLGSISATADLDGTLNASSGGISELSADRDFEATVSSTGAIDGIDVGRDMTGGSVDAMGIGSLGVGRDMSTSVTATQNIGPVTVGRTLSGSITASSGYIQSVDAGDNWSGYYTKAGNINGSTISAGTYVGDVTATSSPGYSGAMSNVTITAGNGSIGNLQATSGLTGVTASATASIGNISTTSGSITGSFTATSGSIGNVTATYGALSAPLMAGTTIGSITVENNIDKAIHAGGTIGNIISTKGMISGAITSTGGNVGNVTASTGSISGAITSTLGSIGNVTSAGALSSALDAHTTIGDIFSGGDLTGTLSALTGAIGNITAMGNISSTTIKAGGAIADIWALNNINSQINAGGAITLFAGGTLAGAVTTTGKGKVSVDALGDVTSKISAFGTADVTTEGNITETIASTSGGISEQAGGKIDTTATAKLTVNLFSGQTIDNSTITSNTGVAGSAIGSVSNTNVKLAPVQPGSSAIGSGSGSGETYHFNGNSNAGLTFGVGMQLTPEDAGGGYGYQFSEPGTPLSDLLNGPLSRFSVGSGESLVTNSGEVLNVTGEGLSPFEDLLFQTSGVEIGAGTAVAGGAGWTVASSSTLTGFGTPAAPLSTALALPVVAIGAWYVTAKVYANYIDERATDSNYIESVTGNTSVNVANQDRAYIKGIINAAVRQTQGGIQTQLSTQAVRINASSWQQYEQSVRSLYGSTASQQYITLSGKKRIADAVANLQGKSIAVEAKFVTSSGWEASIYNPNRPNGIVPFLENKSAEFIQQAIDYSEFFDAVIYHSNSPELINYYTKVFFDLGLTNVKFVYSS